MAGDYDSKMADFVVAPVDEETMTVRAAKDHQANQWALMFEHRRAQRNDEARLMEIFQRDLAVEHGTRGHPNESLLYSLAYEHGHSSGLHEIALCYEDFAQLLTR